MTRENREFYTYMIKSTLSKRHYYGHTVNLEERLEEHNTNQSPYTKNKGPWVLIGYIECSSRSEAMETEKHLKNMKNPSRAFHWLKRNGVVR